MTAGGFGAALIGGAVGGMLPTYAGLNNLSGGALAGNAYSSIGGEIAYGIGKGALMGGLSASIETGRIDAFGEGAKYGAISGGIGTAALIGYSGRLYNTGYEKSLENIYGKTASNLWAPGFRQGGYRGWKMSQASGVHFGGYDTQTGQITINQDVSFPGISTPGHEMSHYTDVINQGAINYYNSYNQYPVYGTNPYEIKANNMGYKVDQDWIKNQ